MPNRIVREGILTSERVDKLSPPAEVTYRRLMSVVDDFGRYSANPKLIRAATYPLRLDRVSDRDIGQHIAECEQAGLIRTYEAQGKPHLEIIDFRQRTRATASKWPSPDGQLSDKRPPLDRQMTATWPTDDSHAADERRSHDGRVAVNGQSDDGHMRTETETETDAETFDASDLAESLYGRHPKKAGKVLAQQALTEVLSTTLDVPSFARLIDERHAAWCGSPDWRKDGGRFAPKLADWIRNRGWLDDPPETGGDPGDLPEWKGIPDAY